MKISKHSVAVAALLLLAGTAPLPLWAFDGSAIQAQAIDAEFVPTREQVQGELSNLNHRLEAGQMASFYSGEASDEYLQAERYFQFGRYDEALAHARIAERALPQIPNWVTPDSDSR